MISFLKYPNNEAAGTSGKTAVDREVAWSPVSFLK